MYAWPRPFCMRSILLYNNILIYIKVTGLKKKSVYMYNYMYNYVERLPQRAHNTYRTPAAGKFTVATTTGNCIHYVI